MTTQELKIKYGDEITFLFKGEEPYTPDANGNPLGVLIERDGKICCYECGGWYPSIANHIRVHNISAREYKIKYGFNIKSGLCSKAESLRRCLQCKNNRPPSVDYAERSKRGYKRIAPTASMQKHNSEPLHGGACPEQMIQRYKLLVSKFGENITTEKINDIDSFLMRWILREYKSIVKFRESVGIKSCFNNYKNKADLIYDLREYFRENKRLPWFKQHRVDEFPHSRASYYSAFGSMTKALLHCGFIKKQEEVGTGARGHKRYYYELIN
jgi:hypothetical protein